MIPRLTLRESIYGCFVVLCACALIWPGFAYFGNRIEPFILGLPFGLAWNIGWVLASFLALLIYHTSNPEDD